MRTKAIPFLLALALCASPLSAQSLTNERAQWFADARFGMFIHWGVYSGAEGVWKGEKLRSDNDYAEWIQYRNRIEKEEYLTLLDRFDWDAIDPEEWVLLAKRAGMKYVTLTAKHHDGFALWDSQVGDYDVGEFSHPRRDIVGELAAACQKHGLKLGLYYSHWVDWEHPYGWDHTKELHPIAPDQFDQYWQKKVVPQMRELLTGYGPIGLIWFDMWIHHSRTVVTADQLSLLKGLIRELQPDCLINSRLGLSIEEDPDVDFRTLGDNQLGQHRLDYPWQSPATVAHSWGFHKLDGRWKTTTVLLQSLINNVSLNGNFMLNIGPRSNGDVPLESVQRLEEMGQWLAVNGESIYGAGAFDLRRDLHDWGRITHRAGPAGAHTLYLHVYTWPFNHLLPLTGVGIAPRRAYLLADKQRSPLPAHHEGLLTTVSLPARAPDGRASVVALEYDARPEVVPGLVARTVDGGHSLTHENRVSEEGDRSIVAPARGGTVPKHVALEGDYTCRWKMFIEKAGRLRVDASYSAQGDEASGTLTVAVGPSVLEHPVRPTGQTVGEPNQRWHIDNFAARRVGSIDIPAPGVYDVSMQVRAEEDRPVQFQWLWLAPEAGSPGVSAGSPE
jgi:alpha-L-fucosidase